MDQNDTNLNGLQFIEELERNENDNGLAVAALRLNFNLFGGEKVDSLKLITEGFNDFFVSLESGQLLKQNTAQLHLYIENTISLLSLT